MKLEEYDYKVEAMADYLPAHKGLGEIYLKQEVYQKAEKEYKYILLSEGIETESIIYACSRSIKQAFVNKLNFVI